MTTKDRVLARIRRANAHAGGPGPARPEEIDAEYAALPRPYRDRHGPDRTPAERVDLLAANLTEYRAHVHRTDPAGLPALVAALLTARGARSLLVPEGVPAAWTAALDPELRRVPDDPAMPVAALDAVDSVLTDCALAIAETGTLITDGGPGQGRRRAALVPDHHICVVRVPDQVVDSVPLALPHLDPTRAQTWTSGPSATSDIELDRVEGVHGPRRLDVVLLEGPHGP
ncbi:LutC/YkgG family protein [Streptomyces sp. BI20]|uniref:LutC/YkgG family protein n=1 Tax=Streptomyces sp. BI20 TaxID=3403460 RepID=UPI003C751BD2